MQHLFYKKNLNNIFDNPFLIWYIILITNHSNDIINALEEILRYVLIWNTKSSSN